MQSLKTEKEYSMARHREAAPEQTEYPSSFDKYFGSIAQLVQSICLTSRGSAVRTRVLPLSLPASAGRLFYLVPALVDVAPCPAIINS